MQEQASGEADRGHGAVRVASSLLSCRVVHGLKKVVNSFASLAFPNLCLHCSDIIVNGSGCLCLSCAALLELIEPSNRCIQCFGEGVASSRGCCAQCAQLDSPFEAVAAAFDYCGPAASIVRQLKYGNRSDLAKGAAGFLALQFLELGWPYPDLIVPVPIAFTHYLQRGYNQSLLMANSLSEILGVPCCGLLKRHSGDYSQAGLAKHQRQSLPRASFFLAKGASLQDKNLLVIDDVLTTAATLRCCALALAEEVPARIYGLALCRATK